MTTNDVQNLSVSELREMARSRHYQDKADFPKSVFVSWRKAELVDYIVSGILPTRREALQQDVQPEQDKPVEKQEAKLASPPQYPESSALALGQLIQQIAGTAVNEEKVREIVKEAIASVPRMPASEIKIVHTNQDVITLDRQHYVFELIYRSVLARDGQGHHLNIYLTGPAGSSKSSIALNSLREALGNHFELLIGNPMMSKSDLLGFVDAGGNYHESPVYRAMKEGKTLVFDEGDNADPGILIILNTLAANRVCTFPNGETLDADDKFRLIFIGNTCGMGATEQYSRMQLDAATLDRFVVIDVPYDEGLEAKFIGINGIASPPLEIERGGTPTKEAWYKTVIEYRRAFQALNLKNVVSPRATVYGVALASMGIGEYWLKETLLYKGLTPDQRDRVNRHLGA